MYEVMYWSGNEALTMTGEHRWDFDTLKEARDGAEFMRKAMVRKGATEVTIRNTQTGKTFSADPRDG